LTFAAVAGTEDFSLIDGFAGRETAVESIELVSVDVAVQIVLEAFSTGLRG
jgi:hypothetical protein